jgi:hypothetical protein
LKIWKEWNGYKVSNHGDFISKRGKPLAIDVHQGYHRVKVFVKKKMKIVRVHRIVLELFKGPQLSDKHHSRHLDGNRSNNHIDNLEWGTHSENENDKLKHGTSKRTLTDEQVIEIRNNKTDSHAFLGRKYNVHATTIGCIRRNKSYRNL